MSQPEQPWMPAAGDIPWMLALVNPQGDRHLALNDQDGCFYRLWQHHPPQQLHGGDAILLRPSDIDQIIKAAFMWSMNNPSHPRAQALTDEVAQGAKAVVLHFAQSA